MTWLGIIYIVGILCFGVAAYTTFPRRQLDVPFFIELTLVLMWPLVLLGVLFLRWQERR